MLGRLANSLKTFVGRWSKKEMVGMDNAGNKYFKEPQEIDGLVSERRWVEFKGLADPRSLPVEWCSWLSRTRTVAPTAEEIEGMELSRKMVKYKAAVLEQEEEKRRFRVKSLGHGISADDVSPQSMERMMQQISSGAGVGRGKQKKTHDEGGSTRTAKESATVSKQSESSDFAEPSGHGDSFQPGSWQPPDDIRR